MVVQEGRKGQREAHSLICSLRELGEEHGEENGSIRLGKLGRLLPWRSHGGLDPHLFVMIVLALRRVLAHRMCRGQNTLDLSCFES
jgi:hypothetical protein